jgi:hypothetical protein
MPNVRQPFNFQAPYIPGAAIDPNYDPESGQMMHAPQMPGYVPPWDNSFSVSNYMQPTLDDIQVDTRGLTNFENEANRSGEGAWAGLAKQLAAQTAGNQRDQAQGDAAGATAQAETNLAMHGGLDSGARERAVTAGTNQLASRDQAIGNQEAQADTQIGMQDEQNRIQEQEALPGIQNQYLQPQFQKAEMGEQAFATDVQGAEGALQGLNAFNQSAYSTQAQIYGADQQARATMANGGGNWAVTELAKHQLLPADARRCLTAIRFAGAELERKAMVFYFTKGPKLVSKLNAAKYDWADFGRFIETLCELVRLGEVEAATRAYRAKIVDLIARYWPECPHREFRRQMEKRAARIRLVDLLPAPRMMGGKLAVQCGANIPADRFRGYTELKEKSPCHG